MHHHPSVISQVSPEAKALIFDCDGTLIDTMALHFTAFHEELSTWGYRCDHAVLESFAGIPTTGILETFNAEHGWNIDIPEFCRRKEARFTTLLPQATEIEVVTAVVKAYYAKLPMAVVSSGIVEHVATSLEIINLGGYFDTVVTASDNVRTKPHPDMFLLAAERLGIPPESCQVFEDADAGIRGAEAAGMMITDVRPYTLKECAAA